MLNDLSQLLNQPPGSLVYHLVTLFALQIVFGLASGIWRRDRQNRGALRMMVAAGGIFVMRLVLLLAVVLLDGEETAVSTLISLNQVADSVTAVLLVWTLVPQLPQLPRLGDTLMAIGLFLILTMGAYFVQSGGDGEAIWTLFAQIGYGMGFIFLLASIDKRITLRPIILFVLLVCVTIGWMRLGYLVAFPLWAVLLYHETNRPVAMFGGDLRDNLTRALTLTTAVIRPTDKENILHHAIYLAADLTQSAFVGIITIDPQEPNTLHLISNQPQIEENEPRSWTLNLTDWPAFRQVLSKQQPVELMLVGRGARQLAAWYQEMGLPPLGSLLILPITAKGKKMGLLLFAGHADDGDHDEQRNQLAVATAVYIATAMGNVEEAQAAVRKAIAPSMSPLQEETAVSGHIITLERELADAVAYNRTLEARLQQSDQRLSDSGQRLQALAATVAVMEKRGRTVRTAELEDEVASLREALLDAEEALAMAAASETEISTEWVMLTITRYSGQLEEAHMQIQALKNELMEWEKSAGNQAALLLVRELRAPITAVTGYTDLLMREQAGIITDKQRSFLTNIQSNAERMAQLLTQLVQATADSRQLADSPQVVLRIEDIIETAVDGVLPQIRDKQLRFDSTIAPDLPVLPTAYHMLSVALDGLLEYSCQQVAVNGRIGVTATTYAIEEDERILNYLHLAINNDGANIAADELPHLFDERGASPQLAMSRSLIEAKGGRLWVESNNGEATVFSALLPLSMKN